ncbi:hypothetical protein BC826DRAFT_882625, partial [Russula brevipes]
SFKTPDKEPLHGDHATISFGLSYGRGQMKPKFLHLKKEQEGIANCLMANKNVQRVAGFQKIFTSYFPLSYHHFRIALNKLHINDPTTNPPFRNSVYPAACMNAGPQTCYNAHFDTHNYPGAPCAVTAFGHFNPDTGGHFVLYDLKIFFHFPPGATVLLSSVGFKHRNTAISPEETRYSFTQFCPGGLMRWVAYGCKS